MTQRERKRLSGFCSQSLTESRPLSPKCPQPTAAQHSSSVPQSLQEQKIRATSP